MDHPKRTYRETQETVKEVWRNRDGEDLADKLGNLGDDVRKKLGNAGDDLRRTTDTDDEPATRREGSIDDPDVAPEDPTRPM